GEQSGHVIIAEHATTGDGELTALHLLQRMAETGRTARELADVMTRLPQALINVEDVDKAKATIDLGASQAVQHAEAEQATTGGGRRTALHLLRRMAATGRTARELADAMTRLPQALISVEDVGKARATIDLGVSQAVQAAEAELGETGRVLLRPSGTEP